MAKKCSETGRKVLYTECLECDSRSCRRQSEKGKRETGNDRTNKADARKTENS